MVKTSQNGRKEESVEQSETKPAQPKQSGLRRYATMSNFIVLITFFVAAAFAGIAINYHTRGGYESIRLASLWGIVSYLVLGIGTYFGYYEYVVKPARDAKRAQEEKPAPTVGITLPTSTDRPELFIERARVEDVVVGKTPRFRALIKNVGKATAYRIVLRSASSVTAAATPGPHPNYLAPDIGTGNPESFQLLPSGERVEYGHSWRRPLTEKDVEELSNGTKLLFFTGKGHYEDADGATYEISYCQMFKKDEPPFFLVHC